MRYFFIGIPIALAAASIILKTRNVILITNSLLIDSKSLQYSLAILIAMTCLYIFFAGEENAFINKCIIPLLFICLFSFITYSFLIYLLYRLPDYLFHIPRFYITLDERGKMKVNVIQPLIFIASLLFIYILNFFCLITAVLSPKISHL